MQLSNAISYNYQFFYIIKKAPSAIMHPAVVLNKSRKYVILEEIEQVILSKRNRERDNKTNENKWCQLLIFHPSRIEAAPSFTDAKQRIEQFDAGKMRTQRWKLNMIF